MFDCLTSAGREGEEAGSHERLALLLLSSPLTRASARALSHFSRLSRSYATLTLSGALLWRSLSLFLAERALSRRAYTSTSTRHCLTFDSALWLACLGV